MDGKAQPSIETVEGRDPRRDLSGLDPPLVLGRPDEPKLEFVIIELNEVRECGRTNVDPARRSLCPKIELVSASDEPTAVRGDDMLLDDPLLLAWCSRFIR